MKELLVALFIVVSNSIFSQAFHFDLTERTLIKTVAQSPAHWYLDIFNDVGVDTTLRWKTHFNNIPVEWDINFDDQNSNYTFVQDGDSADFILYGVAPIPQKLIIGAEFNGIHGEGSTLFDIYDPSDLSTLVTIRFKFIVSPLGISEYEASKLILQKGCSFNFDQSLIGKNINLYSRGGRLLFTGSIEESMNFEELSEEGPVILSIQLQEGNYTRTVYLK